MSDVLLPFVIDLVDAAAQVLDAALDDLGFRSMRPSILVQKLDPDCCTCCSRRHGGSSLGGLTALLVEGGVRDELQVCSVLHFLGEVSPRLGAVADAPYQESVVDIILDACCSRRRRGHGAARTRRPCEVVVLRLCGLLCVAIVLDEVLLHDLCLLGVHILFLLAVKRVQAVALGVLVHELLQACRGSPAYSSAYSPRN